MFLCGKSQHSSITVAKFVWDVEFELWNIEYWISNQEKVISNQG